MQKARIQAPQKCGELLVAHEAQGDWLGRRRGGLASVKFRGVGECGYGC